MQTTRRAWWSRAKWYLAMYILVIVTAIFAMPNDFVTGGWKLAVSISASAAFVGTLGTLRVVMGHANLYHLVARMEAVGVGGIIIFEMVRTIHLMLLWVVSDDLFFVSRAAAHMTIAIALGLAHKSRPVRERRIT